ncbi:MAG: hypothetical protein HKN21_02555 [Candidatus Eisenbacteria bacterium]|uniref:O-antigen ligase-related domain-containing protein n=1 Tax=Eiseniibacteriota bacterium TaxID=2212470 RepID=A0A7Y2E6L2_UNCEI|nr:hypothetical protein [Candidatus Eisenbacteria bacterium]
MSDQPRERFVPSTPFEDPGASSPFSDAPEVVRQPSKIAEGWGPGPRAIGRAKTAVLFIAFALFCALVGFNMAFFPPLFIFGALGGILFGSVVLLRPFVGVVLYAALFFLRPAEMFPVLSTLHLERILGLLTLIAMCFEMYRKDGHIYLDHSKQTKWLWGFVFVLAVTIPTSYWPGRTSEVLFNFLKTMAFYLMIVQLVNTRARLKVFTFTYIAFIAYVGFGAIRSFMAGGFMHAQGIDRAVGETSAGGDPNSLAVTLGTTLPFVLAYMGIFRSLWARLLLLLCGSIFLWGLGLSGSRSGVLGLMTAFFVYWLLSKRKLLLGFVGAFALLLAFFALPESYQNRYRTITSSELDESSQLRLSTWGAGMRMVLDRPILGVGPGAFGSAHFKYRGSWLQPHSLYVQVPAEMGLVGLFVFGGFIVAVIGLNRRTYRMMKDKEGWDLEKGVLQATFIGFCFLFASSIFGHSLFRYTWYFYAALNLAVLRVFLDHPDNKNLAEDGSELIHADSGSNPALIHDAARSAENKEIGANP